MTNNTKSLSATTTTQGMTINGGANVDPNCVNTAHSLLLLGVELFVPNDDNSHNNISTSYLYTGDPDSMSTPNCIASASVHVYDSHNDHFPINTALIPVRQGDPYQWQATYSGDGCTVSHLARGYAMGLDSHVVVSCGSFAAKQWTTVNDDGFLVGTVGGNNGSSQIMVYVKLGDGDSLQLAGASQIYGTDVYLPSNSFCVPVLKGWQVFADFTAHADGASTGSASASFQLFTFDNHQVFESRYEKITPNEAYYMEQDVFVIGCVGTTQDNTRIKMTGSVTTDGSTYSQNAGSSVNCGSNRWSQYNSFLLPVPKDQWFKTEFSGSGSPGAFAYMVYVLPQQ